MIFSGNKNEVEKLPILMCNSLRFGGIYSLVLLKWGGGGGGRGGLNVAQFLPIT